MKCYVRNATQEKKIELQQSRFKDSHDDRWKNIRWSIAPKLDGKSLDKILVAKLQNLEKLDQLEFNLTNEQQQEQQQQSQLINIPKIVTANSIHSKQIEINRKIYKDLLIKKLLGGNVKGSYEGTQFAQNIRSASQQTLGSFRALSKNASALISYINSDMLKKEIHKEKRRQKHLKAQQRKEAEEKMLQQMNTDFENQDALKLDDYGFFKHNYTAIMSNISQKFALETNKIEELEAILVEFRKKRKTLKLQIENQNLSVNFTFLQKFFKIKEIIKQFTKQETKRTDKFKEFLQAYIEKYKDTYKDYIKINTIISQDGPKGQIVKKEEEIDFDKLILECSRKHSIDEIEQQHTTFSIKKIDSTYEKDIENIKLEKEKEIEIKQNELNQLQDQYSNCQDQITLTNNDLEIIKSEKKNLKSIFKQYMHRALTDEEFITLIYQFYNFVLLSKQTQFNGLNYLLAEFQKIDLNMEQNSLPNFLTQQQKNYIIETYPLLSKLQSLKQEIEINLKNNNDKLEQYQMNFGKLFTTKGKNQKQRGEMVNEVYLKLSSGNKNYIQQQQKSYQTSLGNNNFISKRLSFLFKSKFQEISILEDSFNLLRESQLSLMNQKLITTLQQKNDLKFVRQQLLLLFGAFQTEKMCKKAVEEVKLQEVKQKTRILSQTVEEFKNINSNNQAIQRAFSWHKEQKNKITIRQKIV